MQFGIGYHVINVVHANIDQRYSSFMPGSSDNKDARVSGSATTWSNRRASKQARLERIAGFMRGVYVDSSTMSEVLELLLQPGDRVALEGDNQKQADFLATTLAGLDPKKIHDLHMLISSVSVPTHLDLFERKLASLLDFAYSGPQSLRISQLIEDGVVRVGAVHTYVELYARMFVDLIPKVALLCAEQADEAGNLFTGPNTEDTPTIAEATAFSGGLVVVQVNERVARVPRVDIPADWVDVVVVSPDPYRVEPLFTRDPRHIGPIHILQAMMVIRGIYERHQVTSLNHGIGFNTAAIELLLPTYGEELGLRGTIARNWVLNPHPTLIPAIESGWVESVACFGGEPGMENYVANRPDIFFTGRDGSLRSNRVLAQLAGQYGVDLFIGSSLQIDADANSSTVTAGRLSGFGGAPNMGHDPHGRRHASPAWLSLLSGEGVGLRGRKLVVQVAETFQRGGEPTFVESLDALEVGRKANFPVPPVMIYGDDVTHVVTEEGIAHLWRAHSLADRRDALAAIAGVSPVGATGNAGTTERLRQDGLVSLPSDLGVDVRRADRRLLAAKTIEDLVAWSGGLYNPPARFRSW